MLRKRVQRRNLAKRSRFFQLASKVQMEMLEQRVMLSVTPAVVSNPIAPPPLPSQPTPLQGVVGTPNSLDPQLVNTAYDFNALSYDIGGTISKANGAGETIAIVDAYGSPTIIQDVQAFDAETYVSPLESVGTTFGGITDFDAEGNFFLTVQKLAPTTATIYEPEYIIQDWSKETSLDVEWAHAVAPGAHILLVEAASDSVQDLLDADVYAAQQPGVIAVSNSWGANATSDIINGAPVGTATLDGYLVTPDGHTDNNGMTGGVVFLASSGDTYGVDSFPADSRNVLSVGGETDTIDLNGVIENISPWDTPNPPLPNEGSGGGPSTTAPTYTNPIVALDANPETGVWIYDSTPTPFDGATIQGGWSVVGGTSFSCPVWAATIAIIDQGLNLRGFGSMNNEQVLGEEPYDDRGTTALGDTGPTIDTNSATTPATVTVLGDPASGFGILGLAENDLATNADFTQLPGGNNGGDMDSNFPLWGHITNSVTLGTITKTTTSPSPGIPVPDITVTPSIDFTGWGLPNNDSGNIGADTTTLADSARGGFIQDMVGGAVGITIFSDSIDSLYFTQQPVNTQAGTSITSTSPALQVTAFSPTTDGVDTAFNGAVTISILESGTLIGTTTAIAVDGIATFTGLSINQIGTYEFIASSPNLNPAYSNAFNITVAAATHLAVLVQPESFLQNTSIQTPIQIVLEDQFGNNVGVNGTVVTLSINTGPAGGQLSGPSTATTVGGIATFSGVSANVEGTYVLVASSDGVTSVITNPFSVEQPHLVFIEEPTSLWQGGAMASPVKVAVEDPNDVISTVYPSTEVSLQIASGAPGSVLSSTLKVTTTPTVDGVATFVGLLSDTPGTDTLEATSPGMISGTSTAFSVVPVPVKQRYLFNGAALSAPLIELQQLRNVQTFVGPPSSAEAQLLLSELEQPAAVEGADLAAPSAAASAEPPTSPLAANDSPTSTNDSQLLDSTSSTDLKILD